MCSTFMISPLPNFFIWALKKAVWTALWYVVEALRTVALRALRYSVSA